MEENQILQLIKQGESHFASGEWEKAAICFSDILRIHPGHEEALNNLGVVFFVTGNYEAASQYFRLALTNNPTYLEAVENLGKCLAAKGDYLEATKMFSKAFELGHPDSEILEAMAYCFAQLGDFWSARQIMDQIFNQNECKKTSTDHSEKKVPYFDTAKKQIQNRNSREIRNIGFVSIWFERGQAYVTKILRDVLAKDHHTFVFARTGGVFNQPKLETSGFWSVPNLTTYPEYRIPKSVIQDWIRDNRLDIVIFNEEYDWDLVKSAKDTGAKVLTYLDYYKDDWRPLMRIYDAVLCSTVRTYNLVKEHCNAFYIGWAVDTNLFKPQREREKRFTFFHNAGWLGINYRKMTPAVILAFDAISQYLPEVTLLVHAQAELEKLPPVVVDIVLRNPRITYLVKTVPAPGLYHKGKILVFPSKLEGLGLPLFEALASGLPVISTDAPPMNEFIQHRYNGLLVRVAHKFTRTDNIAFPETIIDLNDLADKMALAANDYSLVETMSTNARRFAEDVLNVARLKARIDHCLMSLPHSRDMEFGA